jgi:PAS domain S-box-containing protein
MRCRELLEEAFNIPEESNDPSASYTILVIDDSPEDRELYRRYLMRDRDYSYRILEAGSGRQGIGLWQQQQSDAVLLDSRLPDCDGLAVLTQLQQSLPPEGLLPAVVVTGQGNESIAVALMKAGAQDYLVKDQITPERLQLTVQNVIQTTQLHKQLKRQRAASERRFASITKLSPVGIFYSDRNGHHTYVNDRCCEMMGLTPAEALGLGWARVLHPDDRERVLQQWEQFIQENVPFHAEYRFQRADGTIFWVIGQASAEIDDQGQILGYVGTLTDISDRKQAEVALRESEEQFRSMADNAPIMVWVTDATGCCTYLSRSWYDFTGQTDATGLGFGWLNAVHPEDATLTRETFVRANEHHEAFRLEYRLRHRDGEYCWAIDAASPWIGSNGEFKGYIGSVIDISDRKQAEITLAANEARLRGFFESSVVGMLYGDIYGGISAANDEFLRIVGYTREDLETGALRWIDITPSEFLPLDAEAIDQARRVGACTPYEKDYIRKDGRRVPVLVGYSLVGEAREESVAFILDLSERKQAEREAQEGKQILDTLMEYVPEGITIADAPNVTIRQVSRFGQQLAGRPLEELKGSQVGEHIETWNILYADGVTPATADVLPLTRAVQHGEVVIDEEWILQRPDGTQIVVLCNAGPIYVDGNITGGVIVWRDISDRVQFERDRERILQQEQAAREEAERANRIKDEFLAVLSHELRSPLNPILGWTKLMQSHSFEPTETATALATIERSVRVQIQLIDDLLDVAKILRGKLNMIVAPVDLVGVVQAAIETVSTAASAKSIDLTVFLNPIRQVMGDAARLQQVVWNLLSNAVKFTPHHGRVEIRLEQIDDQAQITVRDTGKGIKPEFLPHVFESFCQEDFSTTRKFGGLGLGLAIVRSLVEAHGGTIWADSPGEGQGATFTVQFPLLPRESESAQVEKAHEPNLELTGIRVLAVDDDPEARRLLTAVLTKFGAEVLTVASAGEVLAVIKAFQPDVLVSDIGMPEMDGYGLIQQIRTDSYRQGQLPAIALTAYASEDDQQRATASGYQQHLAKPLDPERLVEAVVILSAAKQRGS